MARLVKFGEWLPDSAFYQQEALLTAKGVLPSANGYLPLKSFAPLSAALSERMRGGILHRRQDGVTNILVGTASKLIRFDSANNSWIDISDATYSATSGDTFWSMAQWGDKVLAVNLENDMREYDFSTLPATASVVSGAPRGKHVIVVKDHVVVCGLAGQENKLKWSSINDYTGWTVGVNLCDEQEFPDGGRIMAAYGGEYGYILQERKVRLMVQAPGAPEIFQFETLADNLGCVAPRAAVGIGNTVFFLANSGFYMISGNSVKPIADERINRWFFDNVNKTYMSRVNAGYDSARKIVVWAFISKDATITSIENYVCDKILIYHIPTGRWSYSEENGTGFIDANLGPMGLESLDVYGDLDSLPYSLDSDIYNVDRTQTMLFLFDENHQMGTFGGDNQEAVLELVNLHLNAPHRSLLRGVMPMVDSQGIYVSASAVERLGDTPTYGAENAIGVNGWSPQHVSGRLHSIKVRIPAGSTWTRAVGMYIDAVQDGEQ